MKAFQKMLINVYFLFHDFFSGNHLDHSTVRGLFFKVETVVMSLGVGTNFMRWGIRPGRSVEADWRQSLQLVESLVIHNVPARHYSGCSLSRAKN